jgi:hypothetical protein
MPARQDRTERLKIFLKAVAFKNHLTDFGVVTGGDSAVVFIGFVGKVGARFMQTLKTVSIGESALTKTLKTYAQFGC